MLSETDRPLYQRVRRTALDERVDFRHSGSMKLSEWIEEQGLSCEQAALRLRLCNGTALRRYAREGAIPRRRIMQLIYIGTSGQVTPNDFYALSETDEIARAAEKMQASEIVNRRAA